MVIKRNETSRLSSAQYEPVCNKIVRTVYVFELNLLSFVKYV